MNQIKRKAHHVKKKKKERWEREKSQTEEKIKGEKIEKNPVSFYLNKFIQFSEKKTKIVRLKFFLRYEVYKCVCESLSHVWLFVTPCSVACQAPLSKGAFQTRILRFIRIILKIISKFLQNIKLQILKYNSMIRDFIILISAIIDKVHRKTRKST